MSTQEYKDSLISALEIKLSKAKGVSEEVESRAFCVLDRSSSYENPYERTPILGAKFEDGEIRYGRTTWQWIHSLKVRDGELVRCADYDDEYPSECGAVREIDEEDLVNELECMNEFMDRRLYGKVTKGDKEKILDERLRASARLWNEL